MSGIQKEILVIEDGDEYIENLRRFVPGPTYTQVHSGRGAVDLLRAQTFDFIYLDMRFDRVPEGDLLGDMDAAIKDQNGDADKALRFLQNNQGLYILAELKENRLDSIPIILAYDFTRETKRFEHLRRNYPTLTWVPDAVSPGQIQTIFKSLGG